MATVILAPPARTSAPDHSFSAAHPIYGVRPLLRGRLHQATALASIPSGVHVVTEATDPGSRPAVLVYAITCTLMFATSATYHIAARGVVARFWMRRLDHSMILVHMAGGTTPVALFGIGGGAGRALFAASWTLGIAGAAMKLTTLTADRDPGRWFFAVVGWLPLLAVPSLVNTGGWQPAALLLASTATYTTGAICFARKSPDPAPTIFGYHEVWHVFTLVASAFQLLLTLQLAAH